ncbi:hypothetical protein DENSPDRAFT_838863 [Dentipellis sp. KUC8613]|nr:hypothetical protein DENSPDRAFT_838863 [Dentipellis sp. KUC8613]
MAGGPPISKASIISGCLEAIFYGFSVFMFGMTIWILYNRRATAHVNWTMVACSCVFFTMTTMHMIIDIVRLIAGLVTNRTTYPGGPEAWFSNLNNSSFVLKNIVYLLTATFGDVIVIYRCYMVWQKWWILIFPGFLIGGTGAAGIASVYYIISSSPTNVSSYDSVQTWITVFYAMTISTNFICTLLLAYRIWSINQRVKQYRLSSRLPVLTIIIDSGVLYAAIHFVILICWVIRNNLNYVFLDMAMPIIAIAFYMVIVRISMAKSTSAHVQATLAGEGVVGSQASVPGSTPNYQMRPLEVHIAQLTETDNRGGRDTKTSDAMDGYDDVESGPTRQYDTESESDKGKAV